MESGRRLNSWKEIAAHFGVSTRTVQRWEKTEGLPARRHRHEVLSSVFAYAPELDQWWHSRPDLRAAVRESQPTARSVAVLPIVNLNRDEEGEILSDGLTEELINALAQVRGIQVVARTSAFHFKGRSDDIRTIGAKLGVQTILEGSLRRSDHRIRVTAQLINVADGYHVWSERFDRDLKDLFELQDELAGAIVDALEVRIAGRRPSRQDGRNPEALELYLEGRYHANRRTRAGFLRAVECFTQAIAQDDRMARAWAGLAGCHGFLGQLAGIPVAESMPKAKAAAIRALEIDSSLADAHCAIGFVEAVFDYEWSSAEGHFRRALECSPDHADSHVWLGGHVLAPVGRLEEAAYHARRSCELDPLSPPALSGLCGAHLMLRQPGEAIAACHKALEVDPGYPVSLRFLGEAYLLENRIEEATKTFSKIDAPVIAAGFLGYCHARCGREGEARRILAELEAIDGFSLSLQIATIHLGLEEFDSAISRIHQACRERSLGVGWLNVEPIWDPLRPHPRFASLLRELNLNS
jgi:TolB-like protein